MESSEAQVYGSFLWSHQPGRGYRCWDNKGTQRGDRNRHRLCRSSWLQQSHKSFFGKLDMFFLCILHPLSFEIQKQDTEIEEAKFWSLRIMTAPPFDVHRAESSQQHVRALNTQFASWVQSQLKDHPDELWQDGVQDYLRHASNIMEKFRDIVDWLRVNATKTESMPNTISPVIEKNLVAETKSKELNFQLQEKGPLGRGGTPAFANPWASGPMFGQQTPVFPGSQNKTISTQGASDEVDDGEDLEQPSSPSLKKTEEQGVIAVHEVKCKLYVKPDNSADKGWKDMGTGQLSIKCKEGIAKATKESKPTIVVRNDVGKLLLNALLYPGIKISIQKNTIVAIFHTSGGGNAGGDKSGKDADIAVARTYLLRMKSEEETNKLATAIKEYAPPS